MTESKDLQSTNWSLFVCNFFLSSCYKCLQNCVTWSCNIRQNQCAKKTSSTTFGTHSSDFRYLIVPRNASDTISSDWSNAVSGKCLMKHLIWFTRFWEGNWAWDTECWVQYSPEYLPVTLHTWLRRKWSNFYVFWIWYPGWPKTQVCNMMSDRARLVYCILRFLFWTFHVSCQVFHHLLIQNLSMI